MKEQFAGYYRPTQDEFKKLWHDCFFAFDANVLLNLYRYSSETRDALLKLLESISSRCWIPHQAALEYHENRIGVLEEQIATYKKFENPLSEFDAAIANDRSHPFVAKETLKQLEEARAVLNNDLRARRDEYSRLLEKDTILDRLTQIFKDRTGSRYPADQEKSICKDGEARYKSRIPPGFKDDKKDDTRKFGDLIIWHQLKDQAKTALKPVIFITSDVKEDWWWIVHGRTIGPRPELIAEMLSEARVSYYMYEPDRFLSFANEYLAKETEPAAIQEVAQLQSLDTSLLSNIDLNEIRLNVNTSDIQDLREAARLKELDRQVSVRDLVGDFAGFRDLQRALESTKELRRTASIAQELQRATEGIRELQRQAAGHRELQREALRHRELLREAENAQSQLRELERIRAQHGLR